MTENILKDKTYKFAIRSINLYKYLCDKKREFVMSKQVLRSGTSMGALVREAEFAQSKADFINKMSVALKEANETRYWIDLLKETNYINLEMYESIKADCEEILKLLVSTVKTAKNNLNK
ncbi:MAG: four helix bundle protein [Patescibacteria group bacterium]|nr:four helix bundle protein [Patescibacteria group bacterium]